MIMLDKQLVTSDPTRTGVIMKGKAAAWEELDINVKKQWKEEARKFSIANHLSAVVTKGTMEVRYGQLIGCLNRNLAMLRSECGVESTCFIASSSHELQKSIRLISNGYGSGNYLTIHNTKLY